MTDGSFNPPGSGATPPPPPPAAYPTAPGYPSAPGYAPAYPPVPAPKKGTPKWLVPVVLLGIIAVVGVLVLGARSNGDSTDETDDVRAGFVDECVNSLERSTCECWWDELMQRFSAEELIKLGLTESSDPASDKKIQDALAACV